MSKNMTTDQKVSGLNPDEVTKPSARSVGGFFIWDMVKDLGMNTTKNIIQYAPERDWNTFYNTLLMISLQLMIDA